MIILFNSVDPGLCRLGRKIVAMATTRRWGPTPRRLDDEAAARDQLLVAAGRCIVRRGDTQIRMAEVADEAGVVRSTVYRYFANRDDLLLGLVLKRLDAALARWVASLRCPDDAASSIRELILEQPLAAVEEGDALNHALYASESTALTSALAVGAEPVVDVLMKHFAPLLEGWTAGGQLHADLDIRETVHWMYATSNFLLAPSWRYRPAEIKVRFVDRYLLRALLRPVTTRMRTQRQQ